MESNRESHGITVTSRDLPPAHFLLTIKSFSLLWKTGLEMYESVVFKAGGYRWRLLLYPNGSRFVSLYLKIENTSNFVDQWVVDAEFKMFVYNQIDKKYLTIQDTNNPVRRFHETRKKRGFDQFLSLETFRDSSKGYLVNDRCVFGAEVFVIKPTRRSESLSIIERPANGFSNWNIHSFSKLDNNSFLCKVFTAGGRSWQIKVYPGGSDEGKGNSLSVYLGLADGDKLPPEKAICAEYKLRVMDQRRDKHVEKTLRHWFTSSSLQCGFHKFMPLGDLQVSKSYLLNDTLIVEAEFLTLSVSKSFQ